MNGKVWKRRGGQWIGTCTNYISWRFMSQNVGSRVTYSQREGAPPLSVDKEQSGDGEDDLNGPVA